MYQKLRFNNLVNRSKHNLTLILQSIRNRLTQCLCVCVHTKAMVGVGLSSKSASKHQPQSILYLFFITLYF